MPNKIRKPGKNSHFLDIDPHQRLSLAVALVFTGILSRIVFDLGNNIELVTVSSLIAGSYLGFFWALFVPLLIMVISDFLIGNSLIFLFTWSAYLFTGIIGFLLIKSKNFKKQLFQAVYSGIISSLIFYLWTNFGVWFLDSFGMYPDGFEGLIQSYIMGIPFLKNNLLSNLFFVPLVFIIFRQALRFKAHLISDQKFFHLK